MSELDIVSSQSILKFELVAFYYMTVKPRPFSSGTVALLAIRLSNLCTVQFLVTLIVVFLFCASVVLLTVSVGVSTEMITTLVT